MFLTRNVRVEQSHADHWVAWAEASGVPYEALLRGSGAAPSAALAHWCWYLCDRGSLAEAMVRPSYDYMRITLDDSMTDEDNLLPEAGVTQERAA